MTCEDTNTIAGISFLAYFLCVTYLDDILALDPELVFLKGEENNPEPLQLDCDLCAIVSNSGQMVGQKVGNEIDQSSCIWRMNNAPTKGYEEDVGHMTMIRVVSHTSVPLLLKNPDYFFKEANTTIYVIWGPFRNMRKDGNGIVYNMLKKTVDVYPNAQIYVTTEKRMSYCDGVFKKETGKDR
ncbi:Alpha-N-acetylgalactosaminide alpha-2,6-sialyltransferase 3 [Pteropus alecto]|uniref:Alpha-N-acetylgalactosaminide alpha-2,6-sialyltransferase 3 n=1 Tax=Pteropus alecto TaxID=9402 RepID=L5K650_PTEAL|nr:Alpha-N-acetylgalactosaminide alpha-2,6-sialyltransferase 3 [Pteropus alecto]